ncbi:MAG: hypothetical protein Q9227_006669 [Pyrenula ochraceoflavens]
MNGVKRHASTELSNGQRKQKFSSREASIIDLCDDDDQGGTFDRNATFFRREEEGGGPELVNSSWKSHDTDGFGFQDIQKAIQNSLRDDSPLPQMHHAQDVSPSRQSSPLYRDSISPDANSWMLSALPTSETPHRQTSTVSISDDESDSRTERKAENQPQKDSSSSSSQIEIIEGSDEGSSQEKNKASGNSRPSAVKQSNGFAPNGSNHNMKGMSRMDLDDIDDSTFKELTLKDQRWADVNRLISEECEAVEPFYRSNLTAATPAGADSCLSPNLERQAEEVREGLEEKQKVQSEQLREERRKRKYQQAGSQTVPSSRYWPRDSSPADKYATQQRDHLSDPSISFGTRCTTRDADLDLEKAGRYFSDAYAHERRKVTEAKIRPDPALDPANQISRETPFYRAQIRSKLDQHVPSPGSYWPPVLDAPSARREDSTTHVHDHPLRVRQFDVSEPADRNRPETLALRVEGHGGGLAALADKARVHDSNETALRSQTSGGGPAQLSSEISGMPEIPPLSIPTRTTAASKKPLTVKQTRCAAAVDRTRDLKAIDGTLLETSRLLCLTDGRPVGKIETFKKEIRELLHFAENVFADKVHDVASRKRVQDIRDNMRRRKDKALKDIEEEASDPTQRVRLQTLLSERTPAVLEWWDQIFGTEWYTELHKKISEAEANELWWKEQRVRETYERQKKGSHKKKYDTSNILGGSQLAGLDQNSSLSPCKSRAQQFKPPRLTFDEREDQKIARLKRNLQTFDRRPPTVSGAPDNILEEEEINFSSSSGSSSSIDITSDEDETQESYETRRKAAKEAKRAEKHRRDAKWQPQSKDSQQPNAQAAVPETFDPLELRRFHEARDRDLRRPKSQSQRTMTARSRLPQSAPAWGQMSGSRLNEHESASDDERNRRTSDLRVSLEPDDPENSLDVSEECWEYVVRGTFSAPNDSEPRPDKTHGEYTDVEKANRHIERLIDRAMRSKEYRIFGGEGSVRRSGDGRIARDLRFGEKMGWYVNFWIEKRGIVYEGPADVAGWLPRWIWIVNESVERYGIAADSTIPAMEEPIPGQGTDIGVTGEAEEEVEVAVSQAEREDEELTKAQEDKKPAPSPPAAVAAAAEEAEANAKAATDEHSGPQATQELPEDQNTASSPPPNDKLNEDDLFGDSSPPPNDKMNEDDLFGSSPSPSPSPSPAPHNPPTQPQTQLQHQPPIPPTDSANLLPPPSPPPPLLPIPTTTTTTTTHFTTHSTHSSLPPANTTAAHLLLAHIRSLTSCLSEIQRYERVVHDKLRELDHEIGEEEGAQGEGEGKGRVFDAEIEFEGGKVRCWVVGRGVDGWRN